MSKRHAEVLQVALGTSVMSGVCCYVASRIRESAMTTTTRLRLPDELKARGKIGDRPQFFWRLLVIVVRPLLLPRIGHGFDCQI